MWYFYLSACLSIYSYFYFSKLFQYFLHHWFQSSKEAPIISGCQSEHRVQCLTSPDIMWWWRGWMDWQQRHWQAMGVMGNLCSLNRVWACGEWGVSHLSSSVSPEWEPSSPCWRCRWTRVSCQWSRTCCGGRHLSGGQSSRSSPEPLQRSTSWCFVPQTPNAVNVEWKNKKDRFQTFGL